MNVTNQLGKQGVEFLKRMVYTELKSFCHGMVDHRQSLVIHTTGDILHV